MAVDVDRPRHSPSHAEEEWRTLLESGIETLLKSESSSVQLALQIVPEVYSATANSFKSRDYLKTRPVGWRY